MMNIWKLSPPLLWSSASLPLRIEIHKFIGYGPIWVFNQCCTITTYEECPHIFACHNCSSFSHKMCDAPACLKCGGRDHMTNAHPTDLPLQCINCTKDHISNYGNYNNINQLLHLNPLPHT